MTRTTRNLFGFGCLAVAAAAILALGPQSADAGLLSLYTFDDTVNNAVGTAPDGTLVGATYVAGAVGTKALDFDGTDDYVNTTTGGYPKTSVYGAPSNGLWTGSAALWLKTSGTTGACIQHGNDDKTALQIGDFLADGTLMVRIRSKEDKQLRGAFSDTGLSDGQWHHVAMTWSVTTGDSGTGEMACYIDGASRAIPIGVNNVTSAHTFSSWDYPVRVGCGGKSTPSNFFDGSLDDVGIWGDRLSEVEAKALYNLGTDDVLDYNAKDGQTLFDIFAMGPGGSGTTSDGTTWGYVTGLSGLAGTVVNGHTALILDGSGNGVQIPEPGTLALLMTGLIGLLCYAWRKRK